MIHPLQKIKPTRSHRLLFACVCALAALGLISWSLFDHGPVPLVAAMSVGQALGTLSFASYLWVVAMDFRRLRAAARCSDRGDADE
jgi:hypothetical protein